MASAGLYAVYAWQKGIREIASIRHAYKVVPKPLQHWNSLNSDAPFSFARWREKDFYGDALYWPTAACMVNYISIIQETLINDIYASRIRVVSKEDGKTIDFPTPMHVLRAINDELAQLEKDKKILKRYTDIYRRIAQDESFIPDKSLWRIFWPNYNRASRMYIDVVTMMDRLHMLKTAVASLCATAGNNGWPRLQ
jgi:hypothetical protein